MAQQALDPYATLGLQPGASAKAVREAYRRLAKRHHPDLDRDPAATERMRRVNEARDLLSRASPRAPYHQGPTPRPPRARPRASQRPAPPTPAESRPGPSPILIVGLAVILLPLILAAGLLAAIAAGFLPLPLFAILLLGSVRLGAALARGEGDSPTVARAGRR
jgi:preprotein translocase subunit Sec63